jgi:hypothetical protein
MADNRAILYHRSFLMVLSQCPIKSAEGMLINIVDINDLEKNINIRKAVIK